MPLYYLDSSALVKLVVDEPESAVLRRFLDGADIISSELVRGEIPRAVRRAVGHDPALPGDQLLNRADELLDAVAVLPVDSPILVSAGKLAEPALRALDAIHVASALDVVPIEGFVSYDYRQNAAARLAGLRTVAPHP